RKIRGGGNLVRSQRMVALTPKAYSASVPSASVYAAKPRNAISYGSFFPIRGGAGAPGPGLSSVAGDWNTRLQVLLGDQRQISACKARSAGSGGHDRSGSCGGYGR